jgi:hypothetical protein
MNNKLLLVMLAGLVFLSTDVALAATSTTATGTPDLYIASSSLSHSGKSLKAGDLTALKANVANIGTAAASNILVRFSIDGKQVFEKTLNSIGKKAKTAVSYLYNIPATATAPFVFSVSLDSGNTVTESNETNNTAEVSVPVIPATFNLVLDAFKPSNAKPKPGQKISWLVKVKNNGNTKATNVKVALYADMNSPDPTATIVIPSINAKASAVKNISWTVPAHLNPATGYLVRAAVDPDNAIAESNELDNVRNYSLSLTVPDLSIVPDPSMPAMPPASFVYPGTFSEFFIIAKNDNVAAVSGVKVAVYYAVGSLSAPRTKLLETTMNLPKKGGVAYRTDRVFLPNSVSVGTLAYLFVVVDPDNAIAESNEQNNELVFQRSVVQRPLQAQCPCLNITVHDEDGNPMSAAVQVHVGNPASDTTKTAGADVLNNNAPGLVTFDKLPQAAQLTVTVTKAGYRTQTESFSYNQSDQNTVYRTYNMDKKALLSGTVKDQAGQPLPYVTIKIEGTDVEAVTDSRGKYGFMLNGGSYTLRFMKPGYGRVTEQNLQVAPMATATIDKTMNPTNIAYVSAVVTDDGGVGLGNVDVYIDGTMVGMTTANGLFVFNNLSAGTKTFKFKKPGYVETQFSEVIEAGNEYNLTFEMFKPATADHVERGTEIVSWHQHEATPANSFFVPEYKVDVWWGLGRVKMGMDFDRSGGGTKATKLVITNHGLDWECHKVEGEGSIETSAIDIPITISAGGCNGKKTQMDVYKVAIESDGQEIWSDSSFWTTASDPQDIGSKTFILGNLPIAWNDNFKVKMWVRVQKRSVVGTDGDGAGALVGYHLDKKLITWYPQKPATTVISTSWSQVGGYFLGILDNPVSAVTGFTDIFTVERFNQYSMEEVLPAQFPGAPPEN